MAKRGGFPGGAMPGNMSNLMKQAQRMQRQMEEGQKELETKEFTAAAGGGAVEVTVTGKKEVVKVKLSEEVVDPEDIEMLQDLIVAATNEALRKAEEENAAMMNRMTGGLGEVRTNPGMVASFDLPDGSKVWLNSHSCLKYPKRFTGNTRSIELDGEAYFSVQKEKSRRFVVNTPFHLRAEVLGTEFNMEAYKENNRVVTTLVSGSVRISFESKNEKEENFFMKPNDEISYNTDTKKISLNKPYLPTMTAWKDGLVIFRDTPFEEALNILDKRFNVEFIVKNDLLYENSFTGSFDGQHLHLILEHFRLSSGIQYKFVDPQTGVDRFSQKTIVELY